jgi:hypothetical protein
MTHIAHRLRDQVNVDRVNPKMVVRAEWLDERIVRPTDRAALTLEDAGAAADRVAKQTPGRATIPDKVLLDRLTRQLAADFPIEDFR